MRMIENSEAEQQLDSLLDEVELGGSIVITRSGKPVARLVPEGGKASESPEAVIAAIKEFRKSMPRLSLDEILSARHEGHDR